MNQKKQSILVTGVGGMSGRRIAETLLRAGHDVYGLRRSPADGDDPFKTIVADLKDKPGLPEVDVLIHAAATSPMPGVVNGDIVRDNVLGVMNLADWLAQGGARRVLFLSSLSVYGNIAGSSVNEETPFNAPDIYGTSKYLGEQILKDISSALPALCFRLPGIVGRGATRNWIAGVLDKARAGQEIEIYNPDAPYNNIVLVDDLAGFCLSLIETGWDGSDSMVLGCGGPVMLRTAVDAIIAAVGSGSAVKVAETDRNSFVIDDSHARGKYGYRSMDTVPALETFARASLD